MNFKGYCRRCGRFYRGNFKIIMLSLLFSLIAFGFMLTHFSITIDEETWINNTSGSAVWLTQGRFGIYLLNLILSPKGNYTPIVGDWISVILWSLCAPLFLFSIIPYFKNISKFSLFIFCTYFSCLPLCVGEILSYSMFNIQISIAMICTGIACCISALYFKCRRKRFLLISGVLLFFAVSVYQAFLNVYIVWLAICMLMEVLQYKSTFKKTVLKFLPLMVVCAGSAVVYCIINFLINHFIVPDSGYLGNYIGWTQENNIFKALFLALANVVRVSFGITVLGRYVYGGASICITTCSFCAALIYSIVKAKNCRQKQNLFIVTVFTIISPFAMYIVLGTYKTPGRSLLGLALLGAFQWLLILNNYANVLKVKRVTTVLAMVIVLYNTFAMNRLFYDSYLVYKYDSSTVQKIISQITVNGYSYKKEPVFFVGMYKDHLNKNLVISGSCGGSFFDWDDGNNVRLRNFFNEEGYPIGSPSSQQIQSLMEPALKLPCWPNPASISEIDGCIVVHLSEPTEKWYINNGVSK